jgi:hypothetical protein
MGEAVACSRCSQLVDSDWLEAGRCLGCRREHVWLARYATMEECDREQMVRRHHNSTAQSRSYMATYGKKIKRRG